MEIELARIEDLSARALAAHGAGPLQAASVARAIARAEETGNVICGLYYLESYCRQLRTGRVDGRAEPAVATPRPGAVTVDARQGFAQPAFQCGLPAALEAARSCGIATLAIRHSHTCTSLGFFTEQIAREGLIGIGFTNASAIVAGPGGRTPVLGTNPIAFTLPGPDGPSMHADFSTAAVALGKITMAKAAGEKIPLGWAVDSEGRPTTDPEAALSGALVSAASYKGWALGLLVEFMAAGLTGSRGSREVKGLKLPDGPPHGLGQSYILIDPAVHGGDLSASIARVTEAMAGDPEVRIPGAHRVLQDPVEVAPAMWEQLSALAEGRS
ncbi:Ldh family oxidoreductase [Roseibacterium sp. SDUM158017]|uniref:Ldh family oxidoreductase n=1 Tax=Roseicyclus salinarum TaxID=3036773 RepID=UPI0024155BED|nr:Ldh family oxidoreductase [Roseibacterium sp. SDUM158017]MDG4647289.1 Ldh family oxidoreductase [Roseibacterium sp. SDUM158017]